MTASTLWLCPHKSITYEEAQRMLLYKPPAAEDDYEEKIFPCEDPDCAIALNSNIKHRGKGRQHALTLTTEITLLIVSDYDDYVQTTRQYFTTNRIKLALMHLDFPICRHLRTSDAFVYSHYTPECTEHQGTYPTVMDCTCPRRKGDPRTARTDHHYRCCQDCLKAPLGESFFGFRTAHFVDGGRRILVLLLDLCRDLGNLDSGTGPAWTFYALSPTQTKLFSQQWQRWMEYRRGTMAGWEVRPATPISEETTIETTRDERRSLPSKCMSLLHKAFRAKGFRSTTRDSSNTAAQ